MHMELLRVLLDELGIPPEHVNELDEVTRQCWDYAEKSKGRAPPGTKVTLSSELRDSYFEARKAVDDALRAKPWQRQWWRLLWNRWRRREREA